MESATKTGTLDVELPAWRSGKVPGPGEWARCDSVGGAGLSHGGLSGIKVPDEGQSSRVTSSQGSGEPQQVFSRRMS